MIPCSVVEIHQTETTGDGGQRRTGRSLVACNCGWSTQGWVEDRSAYRERVSHEAAAGVRPAGQ
ncbi:hypothetical protein [Streptomyces albogriseolus]|uniref:hypothetical protein n=1 Tax=Streptomyces albogriseolus TaxID=1887 RepID=UPI00345FD876